MVVQGTSFLPGSTSLCLQDEPRWDDDYQPLEDGGWESAECRPREVHVGPQCGRVDLDGLADCLPKGKPVPLGTVNPVHAGQTLMVCS